jgi:hypothetical protein
VGGNDKRTCLLYGDEVVEQPTLDSKFVGLNPDNADTGKERLAKKNQKVFAKLKKKILKIFL